MNARKPWDHNGRSSKDRGYGREHRRLREQLLRDEPLCRLCKLKSPPRITPATIADHIKSIATGGAVHSLANLQPVCPSCHDDKTRLDRGHKPRRKATGFDGWPVDD
jgi:5-methylcytosine-specific restriction protein A